MKNNGYSLALAALWAGVLISSPCNGDSVHSRVADTRYFNVKTTHLGNTPSENCKYITTNGGNGLMFFCGSDWAPTKVYANGKKIGVYERFRSESVRLSDDGKQYAFVAECKSGSNNKCISSNGKSIGPFVDIAYMGILSQAGLGSIEKEFESINDKIHAHTLNTLGNDPHYIAIQYTPKHTIQILFFNLGKEVYRIDMGPSIPAPLKENEGMSFYFKTDKNYKNVILSFITYTENYEEGHVVFLNGNEMQNLTGSAISPDGKHVAYSTNDQGKCLFNIDGQETENPECLDVRYYGPDNKTLAFAQGGKNGRFLINDGKKYGPYSHVSKLELSPDGKRVALLVEKNAKTKKKNKTSYWVVDGKKVVDSSPLPHDPTTSFIWGPDSTHYAIYSLTSIMENNSKPKHYIVIFNPFYTPDGKLGYLAADPKETEWMFYVGDKNHIVKSHFTYPASTEPDGYISSDGKKIGHVEIRNKKEIWWVVENF